MTIEPDPDLPSDVIDAIRANRKIDAIKRLREHRGMGLKEAKHVVEAYARENPQATTVAPHQAESGVGRIVVIAIAMGAAYVAYRYFA
jgi:ribosomal protein L7/L12